MLRAKTLWKALLSKRAFPSNFFRLATSVKSTIASLIRPIMLYSEVNRLKRAL